MLASFAGSLGTAINVGARASQTQKWNNASNAANKLALETIGIPIVDAGTAIAAGVVQGLKGVNAIRNGNTAGGIADIASGILAGAGGKILGGISKLAGKAVAPIARALPGDGSQGILSLARAAVKNAPRGPSGEVSATMTSIARFKGTGLWAEGFSGGGSARPIFFEDEIANALGDGGQVFAGDAANCAEIRACNNLIARHGAEFEGLVDRPLKLSDMEFLTIRTIEGSAEGACLSCVSVLIRRGVTDLASGF